MNSAMDVEIEGAGKVTVERSMRARRMRITVRPGSVRVSVPRGMPLERGRVFALSMAVWIREQTAKIEHRHKMSEGLLRGLLPVAAKDEASQRIVSRCKELARETGLSYTRITIRNQKTRWGSCSLRGAISLNIKLARLPLKLMDYVILHELVHTRIKGHGRDFWEELDRYTGNSRELRRELRNYLLEVL